MTATPATLKGLWPVFASVDDAAVQYWLDYAAPAATWANGDHARMLLACHYMAVNGLGSGTQAQMAAGGATGIKSVSSGALSITFADNAASASAGSLSATSYGQQFATIARAYGGGALLTPSGTLPC